MSKPYARLMAICIANIVRDSINKAFRDNNIYMYIYIKKRTKLLFKL